ncbi:hypothetical protein BOTBODRAFT_170760 [Botryobasidium botryosum FD-172 SS1]|uniref:Uncharacterized protein n=1 Tax=Botryobasidium botryosum (strain FD-172 SS1) TaxID=930990 RepID=A0A067MVR2_BOTB1|nr:hypothetical protein BOTBODRAFT_170760 [Botryobasidium botryosum FD-172 SS1]
MDFLQLSGTEHQRAVNTWFENLLRETANRNERQACEAFECLLSAGSRADTWHAGSPDMVKASWPLLIAAFHATWPVSPKLLNVDRALHARRMEQREDMARARLGETVMLAWRAMEAAREQEDYMWWTCLEERNRLTAFRGPDWAEFEEWERSGQVAHEEDKRVQCEYEAQEIAREEEDLAWQAQEEQLDEDWRARVAVMEAEGRRAAVELGIVHVLRVKEVLRAEAEVEDRRRRQEMMRQWTTAHCVRHPLYTTPTTLVMLPAPPNTTIVGYPLMPEIIATNVLEPTAKKPPDGWDFENTPREPVGAARAGLGRGITANRWAMNVNGPTRREFSTNNRRRGVVVFPPTKHPTRTPESPNICPIQKWKKSAPNKAKFRLRGI